MPPQKELHAIIIGAGPAGLSAALALHRQSQSQPQSTPSSGCPIRVTVLELRPAVQTLGGAVNLTPLAMRYLDALGVGPRMRALAAKVPYIEMLSHRTGASLARLWPDADAVRVLRQALVDVLVERVREVEEAGVPGGITLRYGVCVSGIEEFGESGEGQAEARGEGGVRVRFTSGAADGGRGVVAEEEVIEGDFVIGCDGIHSFVRSRLVDPERKKTYSGRASAYGFVEVAEPGDAGIRVADGSRAVNVTSLVSSQKGSLLISFFEASLKKLYLATVIAQPEEPNGVDGRRATGEDKEAVKKDFLRRFQGGKLAGLEQVVQRCDEWVSFPVYMLPPDGAWSKGRVLLLGDAAHAMPPQGESTGLAIEDGMLLAHIFSRRDTRSVPQMFADYETLRRPDINKAYSEAVFRWEGVVDRSWFGMVIMEWFTALYIWFMNHWSKDNFGRDVRELDLPA